MYSRSPSKRSCWIVAFTSCCFAASGTPKSAFRASIPGVRSVTSGNGERWRTRCLPARRVGPWRALSRQRSLDRDLRDRNLESRQPAIAQQPGYFASDTKASCTRILRMSQRERAIQRGFRVHAAPKKTQDEFRGERAKGSPDEDAQDGSSIEFPNVHPRYLFCARPDICWAYPASLSSVLQPRLPEVEGHSDAQNQQHGHSDRSGNPGKPRRLAAANSGRTPVVENFTHKAIEASAAMVNRTRIGNMS